MQVRERQATPDQRRLCSLRYLESGRFPAETKVPFTRYIDASILFLHDREHILQSLASRKANIEEKLNQSAIDHGCRRSCSNPFVCMDYMREYMANTSEEPDLRTSVMPDYNERDKLLWGDFTAGFRTTAAIIGVAESWFLKTDPVELTAAVKKYRGKDLPDFNSAQDPKVNSLISDAVANVRGADATGDSLVAFMAHTIREQAEGTSEKDYPDFVKDRQFKELYVLGALFARDSYKYLVSLFPKPQKPSVEEMVRVQSLVASLTS